MEECVKLPIESKQYFQANVKRIFEIILKWNQYIQLMLSWGSCTLFPGKDNRKLLQEENILELYCSSPGEGGYGSDCNRYGRSGRFKNLRQIYQDWQMIEEGICH